MSRPRSAAQTGQYIYQVLKIRHLTIFPYKQRSKFVLRMISHDIIPLFQRHSRHSPVESWILTNHALRIQPYFEVTDTCYTTIFFVHLTNNDHETSTANLMSSLMVACLLNFYYIYVPVSGSLKYWPCHEHWCHGRFVFNSMMQRSQLTHVNHNGMFQLYNQICATWYSRLCFKVSRWLESLFSHVVANKQRNGRTIPFSRSWSIVFSNEA